MKRACCSCLKASLGSLGTLGGGPAADEDEPEEEEAGEACGEDLKIFEQLFFRAFISEHPTEVILQAELNPEKYAK